METYPRKLLAELQVLSSDSAVYRRVAVQETNREREPGSNQERTGRVRLQSHHQAVPGDHGFSRWGQRIQIESWKRRRMELTGGKRLPRQSQPRSATRPREMYLFAESQDCEGCNSALNTKSVEAAGACSGTVVAAAVEVAEISRRCNAGRRARDRRSDNGRDRNLHRFFRPPDCPTKALNARA